MTAARFAELVTGVLEHYNLGCLGCVVVVAAGDEEIERAQRLYERGEIDGYIATAQADGAVIVRRETHDQALAVLLDSAVEHVTGLVRPRKTRAVA